MDWSPACKVHNAEFREVAILGPDHVGERAVDEGAPQEDVGNEWQESSSFDTPANGDGTDSRAKQ